MTQKIQIKIRNDVLYIKLDDMTHWLAKHIEDELELNQMSKQRPIGFIVPDDKKLK